MDIDKRMKMGSVLVSEDRLRKFVVSALLKAGVRDDVAAHVANGLVQTSLRGVDSHGVRLLPHYLEGVRKGRINPRPKYGFVKTSLSTGLFDADHTFGHAAGIEAARKAVRLAKEAGTGHVAIYNSTHFGAAACYSLEIAGHDMIGISFTHADALMKSHGGKRPFFGTNPISFAAPCKGEDPFCLDMATTSLTFNKVKQLREEGSPAPHGTGANSEGVETTDPREISMLLPSGGYKGYGLSMMVEILCSMLTGMPYGPQISKMFTAPMNEKRYLAHFIMAIKIDCFQNIEAFKKRLSCMIKEIREEPPFDKSAAVQVPGDPEKNIARERKVRGIPLKMSEFEILKDIEKEYKVSMDPLAL